MQIDRIPIMVSLHATKIFGCGEGGLGLSRDTDLIEKIKAYVSFGFKGGREATVMGMNAKLSEYTAAVGLANLNRWQETREKWQAVRDTYLTHLNYTNIEHTLSMDWISGTCNIRV